MTDKTYEQVYGTSLKIGGFGVILIGFLTMVGHTLFGLMVLILWSIFTIMLLPWLYVCYLKGEFRFPIHLLRGPHQ